MREIDTILFMGQGARSEWAVNRLKKRLDEALSNLSAFQQGAPQTSEDTEKFEDLVRDIAAALVGRGIMFAEDLKYPGKLPLAPEWVPMQWPEPEKPAFCKVCGGATNYAGIGAGRYPCWCK